MRDFQEVGRDVIVNAPGWEQKLKDNQQQFVENWVKRPGFQKRFTTICRTPLMWMRSMRMRASCRQHAEKEALVR